MSKSKIFFLYICSILLMLFSLAFPWGTNNIKLWSDSEKNWKNYPADKVKNCLILSVVGTILCILGVGVIFVVDNQKIKTNMLFSIGIGVIGLILNIASIILWSTILNSKFYIDDKPVTIQPSYGYYMYIAGVAVLFFMFIFLGIFKIKNKNVLVNKY